MLFMHKEMVFSLTDLRYVTVSCEHCKTRVILDLKEKPQIYGERGIFLPKECPGCRKNYDSALKPGLESLQKAYDDLTPIEKRIAFRGDVVDSTN
jgi:hypothetical protein